MEGKREHDHPGAGQGGSRTHQSAVSEDLAREQHAAKGPKDHACEEAHGPKHGGEPQRQPVGEGEIDRKPGRNRLPQPQRSQVYEPDRPEGRGTKSRGNAPGRCGCRFWSLVAQSEQAEDARSQPQRAPGRKRSPPAEAIEQRGGRKQPEPRAELHRPSKEALAEGGVFSPARRLRAGDDGRPGAQPDHEPAQHDPDQVGDQRQEASPRLDQQQGPEEHAARSVAVRKPPPLEDRKDRSRHRAA